MEVFFRNCATVVRMQTWTFLTTHGRTMLFIARHPDARLRDIAGSLDVTERTVTAAVRDLADAGYVVKHRQGRRNRYEVQRHMPLHDVPDGQRTVGELLEALGAVEPDQEAGVASEPEAGRPGQPEATGGPDGPR